jgi:hypothetical protein
MKRLIKLVSVVELALIVTGGYLWSFIEKIAHPFPANWNISDYIEITYPHRDLGIGLLILTGIIATSFIVAYAVKKYS